MQGIEKMIKKTWAQAADFLFLEQGICPVCGSPHASTLTFGLCQDCAARVERAPSLRELVPGTPQESPPLLCYSMAFYNNFLRAIFTGYKFGQKTYLEPVFQAMMRTWVKALPALKAFSWVSYIPQSHRKTILRGAYPAEALAAAVADALSLPLVPTLSKGAGGRAQKRTSYARRGENARGKFQFCVDARVLTGEGCREAILFETPGLLVDDFLTTGSTMKEGLTALQEAGIFAVGLCMASVEYPAEQDLLVPVLARL